MTAAGSARAEDPLGRVIFLSKWIFGPAASTHRLAERAPNTT
ncbi:hypothetical protein [Halobacillus sp. Cin3]|nr:hypothetical protein [Halobacillus sp. Cin3]